MSSPINLLIEMKTVSRKKPTFGSEIGLSSPKIDDLKIDNFDDFFLDTNYNPVELQSFYQRESPSLSWQEEKRSSYIVRGHVDNEEKLKKFINENQDNEKVINIYSDPRITCFTSTPHLNEVIGNYSDVAKLLEISQLHQNGMDGCNVFVAIVDTGLNLKYLKSKGQNPKLNKAFSWNPSRSGFFLAILEKLASFLEKRNQDNLQIDHGTMCAFNVCHIAPRCTLLDHTVIREEFNTEPKIVGLLSDAIQSYNVLLNFLQKQKRSNKKFSLVVNNSWGMYNPDWDYAVGNYKNYSNNPTHPFNRIVQELEEAGADILFAAGNCGAEDPHPFCSNVIDETIYGANSHPNVLSIAAVNVNKERLGYSSKGPGRLENRKPDLCAYSHFEGSRQSKPDAGTSTACAVATGVVAAIRSKYPSSLLSTAELRELLRDTAEKLSTQDFDHDHGYGLINVDKLLKALNKINNMEQNYFKNIVEQRPVVLKTLQKVAISANPKPSMVVGVDDVILLSIALPLTSYLVREVGLPWLSTATDYSELWRLKLDTWVNKQYEENGIDKEQAKQAGEALRKELESTDSTKDREVWGQVLELLKNN